MGADAAPDDVLYALDSLGPMVGLHRPRIPPARGGLPGGVRGRLARPALPHRLGHDQRGPAGGPRHLPGPTATGGAHIDTVERQTVPLPEALAETLTRLDEQLYRLAGQAPLAVLEAVATLEDLVRDVAHQAATAVEADDLAPETIGTAPGSSPDKAGPA